MKRIVLAVLSLVLIYCETGEAQSTDFPNVLDKGGIQVLCKSAVAVSAPADTSEDTLATCTVPANAMGANGALRISAQFSVNNTANAKNTRVRFSAIGGTIYGGTNIANQTGMVTWIEIRNRNATNSQVGYSRYDVYAGAGILTSSLTSAVDTTAATSIVITCQKATAGETCTLESFLVELMPSN